MTVDATKPTDQTLVDELPKYIRENRSEINSIVDGITEYTTTSINLASGTYTLAEGTDLADVDLEVVLISALNPVTLETITGGRNGQIKIFVMQDNEVSFKDGLKEDGKFYLNQLPTLSTFEPQRDDVLALINVGGNGSSNNGYWKELYRTLSVK